MVFGLRSTDFGLTDYELRTSVNRERPSARDSGCLGSLLDPLEDAAPALRQRVAIARREQAERRVTERDQRPALDVFQPVLHVRADGERHHQGSGDFEQRWTLDG